MTNQREQHYNRSTIPWLGRRTVPAKEDVRASKGGATRTGGLAWVGSRSERETLRIVVLDAHTHTHMYTQHICIRIYSYIVAIHGGSCTFGGCLVMASVY